MAEKKEKRYVSDNAQLMAEWDWEKNNELNLSPYVLTLGSNKKVFWICSKGHEWQAIVAHRNIGGGCPYCSSRRILKGFNDLATTHPNLLKEWNSEKNAISPTDIMGGSGIAVWWKCSLGHEWKTSPNKRTSDGTRCPYCANKKVLPGFNDLATMIPSLLKEWHPTKNGELSPCDITESSAYKVWWICEKGHEWSAAPYNRLKNKGCPICAKQLTTSFPEQALYYYIKKHFPDAENSNYSAIEMELDIYIPSINTAIEYDGSYYHKSKDSQRRERQKNQLCLDAGIRLIRVREKGLQTYQECICLTDVDATNNLAIGNTIRAVMSILGTECVHIDLKKDSPAILSMYHGLEHKRNLLKENPALAAEWHPSKNGKLLPEHLAVNSGKQVWWMCKKGHEWQASLQNRSKGKGCPYCSGRRAVSGENDLLSLYPHLVEEWDYEQNGQIKPIEIKAGSNACVRWICSICGHKWEATISSRTRGSGCPECVKKNKTRRGIEKRKSHDVFVGELRRISPHIKVIDEYVVSTQKINCFCEICENEWEALPGNLLRGKGCPYCSGRTVSQGENDLLTRFPEIAKEWDFEKNAPLLPSAVKYGSAKVVWWKCNFCGHSWQTSVTNRTVGYGCPKCKNVKIGNKLRKSHEKFVTEIKQVNPNLELIGRYLTAKQKITCKCLVCNNVWDATPDNLLKGSGCPECAKQRRKKKNT